LIAIAAVSALLMAQGCSPSERSEKSNSAATNQPHEPSMSHPEAHDGAESNPHGEHSMGDDKNSAQAKLTVPTNITPNTSVTLGIDVQDSNGKAIAKFDSFQEKLMHLIAVSDDLQFFNHLHPTYKENGRFEVAASFPQAGGYTLFSDYKPAGKTEQVSVLQTQVIGNSPSAPAIDLNRSKTFGDTKVNLTLSQSDVKAGQEVTLVFNLKETASNQLVKDLQPYLGEGGHLVIVKQSSPLTAANYIHAHAHRMDNIPAGEVDFITSFPKPGKYKLWGQFNRKGKIVTADFWIDVSS